MRVLCRWLCAGLRGTVPDSADLPRRGFQETLEPPCALSLAGSRLSLAEGQEDGRPGLQDSTVSMWHHAARGHRGGSLGRLHVHPGGLQAAWLEAGSHCVLGVSSWALESQRAPFFIFSVPCGENVALLVFSDTAGSSWLPGVGRPRHCLDADRREGRCHLWPSGAWPDGVCAGLRADLPQKEPLAPPLPCSALAASTVGPRPVRLASLWSGAWGVF